MAKRKNVANAELLQKFAKAVVRVYNESDGMLDSLGICWEVNPIGSSEIYHVANGVVTEKAAYDAFSYLYHEVFRLMEKYNLV